MSLGASGAVSSILTFFILNFPREIIYVYFIPMPAWVFGLLFAGYSFANMDSHSNIGHAGHVGGMIAGWFYFILTKKM